MRYAFIETEEADLDVCFFDYDGHVTVDLHVVTMFDGANNQVDERYFKVYVDAVAAAEDFVDNGLKPLDLD